jgi:hypothetical protein
VEVETGAAAAAVVRAAGLAVSAVPMSMSTSVRILRLNRQQTAMWTLSAAAYSTGLPMAVGCGHAVLGMLEWCKRK